MRTSHALLIASVALAVVATTEVSIAAPDPILGGKANLVGPPIPTGPATTININGTPYNVFIQHQRLPSPVADPIFGAPIPFPGTIQTIVRLVPFAGRDYGLLPPTLQLTIQPQGGGSPVEVQMNRSLVLGTLDALPETLATYYSRASEQRFLSSSVVETRIRTGPTIRVGTRAVRRGSVSGVGKVPILPYFDPFAGC